MKPTFKMPVLALITASLAFGGSVIGALAQTNPFTPNQTYCLNSSTPCVLSYHNDNNRDGVNPNETILKASTLKTTPPQPQWLVNTDGLIYTQPLYIHQLKIGSNYKNVTYVATENNTVYAFDDTGVEAIPHAILNVPPSGSTEIALPWSDTASFKCDHLVPEIGITGTPVIDVSVTPPVIYLVTTHEDIDGSNNKTYRQKLHGLFADTLMEIPGSPLILTSASFNGGFLPRANLQRAGLALVVPPAAHIGPETVDIWVSFGSNCDDVPYHGFEAEFTYTYSGTSFLAVQTFFDSESTCPSTTSNCQSGIWMSGSAPASDSAGNIYLVTGNGDDQSTQGSGEYSNSVVRVNSSGLQDFYSPPDYHQLNVGGGNNNTATVACTNATTNNCPNWCAPNGQYCQVQIGRDSDLGSAGLTLLSPTFSLTNPELVTAGKQGMLYVVFSGNMGHIDGWSAHPDEYACTTAASPASGTIRQCFDGINLYGGGLRGAPAFFAGSSSSFQNYLYVVGGGEAVKAFQMNTNQDGTFNTTAVVPSQSHIFGFPGAAPSVTWNSSGNTSDAIVWALDTSGYGNVFKDNNPGDQGNAASVAQLYAYGAVPNQRGQLPYLWDTQTAGNGSSMQGAVKFVVPTIVDGKIFLAGGAQNYYPGCPSTSGTCMGTYTACPTPSKTVQPTACGALAMFK